MRSLNRLKATIPEFFKNFVDNRAQQVEIVQLVEKDDYFVVLTYDTFDEVYTVSEIAKVWSFDESNAFVFNDTYYESDFEESGHMDDESSPINSFEGYAQSMFMNHVNK